MKAYVAVATWLFGLLLAAGLLLVLGWGALHGWIVPRIGELRPRLEIAATKVLGVPVRIGAISARSDGLIPSFELSDVVLADAQGREALRLRRVVAALSPRSLWRLGFDQLYIEQPALDVRRTADGRVLVAALDFSQGGEHSAAADWLFAQSEVVIRGGTLHWTDERLGAPPLALQSVDLVLRNTGRRHALRLDATPPPEWGERFSLRGLFREPFLSTHHGRWREWRGQLHGDFPNVDVSQLGRHADVGVEVASGRGAVRLWADVVRGEVIGAAADVLLQDVSTRLAPKLQPLALAALSGRLVAKRLEDGFELETRGLQFDTADGQRWPGGNIFLNWVAARKQQPARGELKADRLDLAALGQIASRLPLGAAVHAALAAHAPKGLVESLQARWQGPLDAPQKYQARGRAVQVGFAAVPGKADTAGTWRPGLRGAEVEFDLNEAGGHGRLALSRGALDLPGVFDEPSVPFDQLSAQVQWRIQRGQISVAVPELKFSNSDAAGEGELTWRTGESARTRFPGVLDLNARLSRAAGHRVWRYLPLGVPAPARDYVRLSIQHGVATQARFRVRGDLRDFPFGDGRSGEFKVSARVQDVHYAFAPPVPATAGGAWPALTQLAGELVFDGRGMQVVGATGRFSGTSGLGFKAQARVPDLGTPVVAVTGEISGPLAESLKVVNGSPLGAITGHALAQASGTGPAEVRLQLSLPVGDLAQSKVQGSVLLAGNDVRITPDSPVLGRARGAVTFTEQGFGLAGVQARALGGDVRLEGGSRAEPATGPTVVVRAQGQASAEGLRQAQELGLVSRLASKATGAAAYTAVLGFGRGGPEIEVTSSLQGLALDLPAPIGKAADAILPIHFRNQPLTQTGAVSNASALRLLDQLSLELGRTAAISYIRDVSGPQPVVLRGGVAIGLAPGESAPLPAEGVAANVSLPSVDLDAWEAWLASASAEKSSATPVAGAAAMPAPAAGYLPTRLALRARELTYGGRTLHDVVLGGSREGPLWRASVAARELDGYVEYREPAGGGGGAGRVHARLARLALAAAATRDVESLLTDQPGSIPALDVVVDDFELRGKKLGRLEIDAVNRGAPAVGREGGLREWRLNKLSLAMPEAFFTATGHWAAAEAQPLPAGGPRRRTGTADEQRRTQMNFRLDIADSGQLLTRFGMPDVIRRGRGRMEGQIAWQGSPLSLDYPTLTGSFHAGFEAGQFLKADPGLAKLLGVLSLQSLPRRLTLDFRDVFSQGFAFDFVRGDVTIEQGIAATNNLQMKGVNAAVLMEGRADIAAETQDLKVVVVPEINAGTASLVAGVINPAIGLGTFLAQLFLREPLMRAATQEFHVDGTWADPRITKVDRRAGGLPRAGAGASTMGHPGSGGAHR